MGGPSAATKEQQQVTLQSSEQELSFQTQLMTLFQQQFASQKGVLDFLQGTLKPEIARAQAGEGFSPQALAAMRTSATDTTASEFQSAQAALNQELKTSGSSNVPSGVTVGADEALLTAEARTQAGNQNTITLANQQQAQNNFWNAINALNGVSAQINPLGYGGEASGAGGTIAGLSNSQSSLQNAITSANNSSFFGQLGGSFASGLGGGLSKILLGGLGGVPK
jgi:hypothetical protein